MSNNHNTEILEPIKTEIKALKQGCVSACNVIANLPPEFSSDQIVSEEELKQKTNRYIKGLETAVQNSTPVISTDINFLTAQFLNDMKQKNGQIEELIAFTNGVIHDQDAEISRLKNLISLGEETQSKSRVASDEIEPEHILKSKERFKMMKGKLQGLLQALFPHYHEQFSEVLGELMAVVDTTLGHIPVTHENQEVVNMLKSMNIVATNPYNVAEVKLNHSL